jgi:pimeloyl-ACP methyl ester carboxylesterase
MPFFERDEIRFHYLDAGEGLPFVFQHGLGGDTLQTRDTFQPPLALRLLTLDCRGHGETRALGAANLLSFDQFADDLLALMNHLGLAQVVAGGISMGAGVALNLALRYPERVKALVLARPAWLDSPLPANLQVYPRIAALIRQYGPVRGREHFQQTEEYQAVVRSHPAGASSLVKQFERPNAAESVDLLERLPADAPNRAAQAWTQLRIPTLILANDLDPVHPYGYGEVLARAIPGAVLTRITSKEIDARQHSQDIQQAVERFWRILP